MRAPSVSFILPVLNAANLLPTCLESIRRLDYPADRYEILVADGGSTDGTLDVVRRYGATLVDATGLLAEAAKHRAFSRATGDYLAMVDADNEIAGPAWLRQATDALEKHPDALGFESYYLKHPADSHLNRYMTGLLQISDPLARTLSGRLTRLSSDADGVECFALPPDGSYPTGANGFLFRRDLLARLEGKPYHEATFFPSLIREGRTQLIKRRGCGVYHHYVTGWRDLYRKKQRTAIHYLLRQAEVPESWDRDTPRARLWLGVLYHGTFIGPLAEGIVCACRQRDPEWLLHPFASLTCTLGNAVGMLKVRTSASREESARRSMELQRQLGADAPGPGPRKAGTS